MNSEPMVIDVDALVKQRMPRHYRYIPRFVTRRLAKIIRERELNELLHLMAGKEPEDAAAAVLKRLQIGVNVLGEEHIPSEGRFIFVSNHPLGGLDGLALIAWLGKRYHGNIRFIVNDLLMAVKPLRKVFLPVNKFGAQSRESVSEIEAQYQSPNQMITFPAGLCSRRGADGKIHDLPWKKFVVAQAIRTHRHIVPLFFEAENSPFFYRMANWRKRLGIKFNAEMILLPGEMIKSSGSSYKIVVGKPISWDTLDAAHPQQEAERLCRICYSLKEQANQPSTLTDK